MTDPRGLGVGTISAWYNRGSRGLTTGAYIGWRFARSIKAKE